MQYFEILYLYNSLVIIMKVNNSKSLFLEHLQRIGYVSKKYVYKYV